MTLFTQLLGLAAADEIARVRPLDTRAQVANDARAGRTCQLAEFLEGKRVVLAGRLRLQQQRALAFSGSFKQGSSPIP
jgi:hypothetical protein